MSLGGGVSSSAAEEHRSSETLEDGTTRRVVYHQRTPPTEHDHRKLFVGGLPTNVTDVEFLEFFQQFGQVVDYVVMVDRLTKRSRGFGFVTFSTEAEANVLLTNIPGKTGHVLINGKQCEVKASTPKTNTDDSARTYHNRHHNSGSSNGSNVVPGMWRSNSSNHHYNRGYNPRHFVSNTRYNTNNNIIEPALDLVKPQDILYQHYPNHDDDKLLDVENEYNGEVNRRNLIPVYPAASFHAMNTYSPNLYQPTYPNALFPTTTASTGYEYLNDGSDISTISSSYPPISNQGWYFDPYAAAAHQQYSNHYASPLPFSNQSSVLSSPVLVAGLPQVGYDSYSGYYVEGYPSSFDL